ncbi:MAG TPA: NrfD/PsrC family molybdoenzyme membrane anchor subunit [Chloroflexia bacterium]|nr:NrfD/PsrC family molybdoenzyme membrane anchor subunit [Chloroflexia bacterium]
MSISTKVSAGNISGAVNKTSTTRKALSLKNAFWLLGALFFLVGLAGWSDRLTNGHRGANYGSIITWGLWVAAYIYFIGLSAGSFLISSLVYVFNVKRFERIGRLAVFTAVVTLLMALLSIWADLGHMERAANVLLFPNFESPMAWMIWLYSTYFLLLVVEMWFLLRRDMVVGAQESGWKSKVYRVLTFGSKKDTDASAERDRKIVRVLATIGVPVAIMFHGGVGTLFGVVAARPLWNTGLFPILFLLSALASGGALLTLITAVFQDGLSRNRDIVITLGKVILGLLLLDVLFQISEYLVAFRSGIPGHIEGLKMIMSGPYWWVFWVWQLGIGTLIPILLLVLPTRKDARWVSLSGLLIALGFIGVRLNIVIPGLAEEEIKGITQAVSTPRLTTQYFPSATEWLLTIGIVGLGLLLFGLGEMLLPKENDKDPVRFTELAPEE